MQFARGALSALCLVAALSGCKADAPSGLETRTATFAKHHIFIRNASQRNPQQYTHDSWQDGKEAFSHYCVACHGADGQNTGVPFATHLSPPVPSLASAEVQSYTDGQLKYILDYGIRPSGMPSSKGTLSDDELWSIVIFLRHLPKLGSQGVPDMYTH
ncbi:cytochrome c [Acidipila sp. EB88]|uniref:c-type cytochrome n=1 Tax=Acidipila sp. EB88 TaxID=2305226 RepID=UPI000F5F799F|nr:cytochrome c [Acidipila sp. EB88]RRA49620.1 cytochrome c [Acidipila sp. EB88]